MLGWLASCLGHFGRYEPCRFALNDQLRSALYWWIENLRVAPPRPVFLPNQDRPLVVSYSDGEGGDAGVGIAAWCVERIGPVPLAGFLEVPEVVRVLWSLQRASYQDAGEFNDITEIEGIGPLLILYNWPWLVKDALWIHFIDNNGT